MHHQIPMECFLGSDTMWKTGKQRWKILKGRVKPLTVLCAWETEKLGWHWPPYIATLPLKISARVWRHVDMKLEPEQGKFGSLDLSVLRRWRLFRLSVRRSDVHVLRAELSQRGDNSHYISTQQCPSSISDWIKLLRTSLCLPNRGGKEYPLLQGNIF